MADISSIILPNGDEYSLKDEQARTDLTTVVKTVNNTAPDANGNVNVSSSGSLTAGTGIDITNDVISNVFQNLGNIDLDTVTYNFQGYVWGSTNYPSDVSTSSGFLIALQRTNYFDHAAQIFIPAGSSINDLYVRVMYNSNWGAWTKIVSPDDTVITNKVLKAGDTMTGSLTMQNNDLIVKDTDVTVNTTSSSNVYGQGLYINDSANTNLGYVRMLSLTNGNQGMQIEVKRTVNGTTKYNTLNLAVTSSGAISVTVSDAAAWRTAISAAAASHTHTKSEITDFPTSMTPTSHTHGKITNAGDITTNVAIASGDRLVINDESASQLNNSSITFGTSTSTFLTNKGTWATPAGVFHGINTGSVLSTNFGTSYTATQDCFVYIHLEANAGLTVKIDNVEVLVYNYYNADLIPLKKGQKITLSSTSNLTSKVFAAKA